MRFSRLPQGNTASRSSSSRTWSTPPSSTSSSSRTTSARARTSAVPLGASLVLFFPPRHGADSLQPHRAPPSPPPPPPGGNTLQGYVVEHWPNGTMDYVEEFQEANRAVLSSIPTAEQPHSAVFSSGCFRHCVTDSSAFWNVYVEMPAKKSGFGKPRPQPPMSLRDAVQYWFFKAKGDQRAPYRVVADCSGFRCGNCTTRGYKHLGKLPSSAQGVSARRSGGAGSGILGLSMGDVLAGLGLGFFTLLGCFCCLLGSGFGGGEGGGAHSGGGTMQCAPLPALTSPHPSRQRRPPLGVLSSPTATCLPPISRQRAAIIRAGKSNTCSGTSGRTRG